MYLGPIEEDTSVSALPAAQEKSTGLFAWGFPRLCLPRLCYAWAELACLFAFYPVVAMNFANGSPVVPATVGMLIASIALLSLTRSFHWHDLMPVDFMSEWRVLIGCSVMFMGLAYAATFAFTPRPVANPMGFSVELFAKAALLAVPAELVYRVLFYRRFGQLFKSEVWSVFFGAISTGLLYTMLCGEIQGMVIGAVVGLTLGAVYLRTGSFALTVCLHLSAILSLSFIAPGICFFP